MVANAVISDWPSRSANLGWPGEPSAMLLPGQVQGWPAGTQRAANAAQRLLSQAVAWWDVEQYRDGDRFLRNRGTGGELLDLRLGSAAVANSNDPRYLAPDPSGGYVYAPGGTFNWLEVPDENALDIVGDIDVRARVALDSWGPSDFRSIVTKRTTTGNQYSWVFLTDPDRYLRWAHSANGSTDAISIISTATVPFADGEAGWVRVTVDVDNGASGNDVKFFTSYDGVTWTQLGNTVTTAGVTSIFSGSAPVRVMYYNGEAASLTGKVYRTQVLNGIDGTTVLDIDCDAITSGSATSFTAVTNQTVTINRSTSGRKSVAVPSRHKGGKPVMLLGTDDYMEIPVGYNWQHSLLNFQQGQPFTVLAVVRQWANLENLAEQLVCKRDAVGASGSPGWSLRAAFGATAGTKNFDIFDGTTRIVVATTTAYTAGAVSVVSGQRLTGTIAVGIGTSIATVADTNLGLVGNQPLSIGRQSTLLASSDRYASMEFYGAAIWRGALTTAQLTTLNSYFMGRIA